MSEKLHRASPARFGPAVRSVLAVVVAVLTIAGCSKTSGPSKAADAVLPTAASTQAGLPKLVDLGATECIPCKMMAPVLEELDKEYAGVMDVEFIDVWQPQNQATARAYGIEEIPTQIFLDPEGKELWRHVGFIAKQDILAKWSELGYDLEPGNNVDKSQKETANR